VTRELANAVVPGALHRMRGRENPSGKLPVTFPKRLEDTAPYAPGHPERHAPQAAPGTSGTNANAPLVTYSEGLAVGYRWLDQEGIEPLFAFGHGLSYTRFEYSGLTVTPRTSGADVTVTVRNVGPVRGSEVVQMYAGSPSILAAFQRIELAAGESRLVTQHVSAATAVLTRKSVAVR